MVSNGAVLLNSSLEEINKEPTLSDKSITAIEEDYEGGTWFSTLESGVYHLKNIHVYNLKGDSSLSQTVFKTFNLNDTAFLFATTEGINKFYKNNVSKVLVHKNEKVIDMFIDNNRLFLSTKLQVNFINIPLVQVKRNIIPFYRDVVLVQSNSELIKYSDDKYLFSQGYQMVETDLSSDPLFKVNYTFSPENLGVNKFQPTTVFKDDKKQLWIGSINRLYQLASPKDKPVPFKDTVQLFKKGITCMRQMKNGIYTIGIRFGGIVLMKDTTVIATISENDGLLSNSIKSLLPLENQLWAATSKGISVIMFQSFAPVQYRIINIGKNEGFYDLIINQLMPFHDNIIASTSKGIYFIENPKVFLDQLPVELPFYINSINYYKGDTSNVSSLSVPYENNRLIIKYKAISFNSAEDIKYFFRINNNDSTWREINGTELLLENLSPGNYQVELKAGIPNQQRFSKIQYVRITIEKPWWQNNYFRFFCILFLVSVIIFIYKRRVNKVKADEKQKATYQKQLLELEQVALRSQMNPHFIFNCLTSIQQLIVSGKAYDANEHLVKFARLIRKTLELSARPFIKISEEKSYLEEYLVLEQFRIPGEFNYSIQIDSSIDISKTEIPNMMLQPIVENAIRHGIKHLEKKEGSIIILLKQEPLYIYCEVTDNGVGRYGNAVNLVSEQKSYGMDIVRKRLELLSEPGNEVYFIEMNDLKNTDGSAAGTQVVMHLPFKIIST